MDTPHQIPDDLRRPKDFLTSSTRPPVTASRPSSSSSSLSSLSEAPSNNSVEVHKNANNVISQDLRDFVDLETTGFVAQAVDQEVLEKAIAAKADKAIIEKEDRLDRKRLEKSNDEKEKLVYSLERVKEKFNSGRTKPSERQELRVQAQELQVKVDKYDADIADINARILVRNNKAAELLAIPVLASSERLSTETERAFLIRTGKITPFAQVPGAERSNLDLSNEVYAPTSEPSMSGAKMTHQNLRRPGFRQDEPSEEESSEEQDEITPPKKRRRVAKSFEAETVEVGSEESESASSHISKKRQRRKTVFPSEDEDYSPEHPPKTRKICRGKKVDKDEDNFISTGVSSEEGTDDDDYFVGKEIATVKSKKRKGRGSAGMAQTEDLRQFDDGNESSYQERLKKWETARRKARDREKTLGGSAEIDLGEEPELEEYRMPHPTEADTIFSGGLKIPGDIFPSLFDYQKVGVQWLWELHAQNAGGIVGDEMGLGKTIQVISFIAGLHHSGMLNKPVLVVAPATVLKQWANEFHLWWPPLRVSILHSSGSGMLNVKQEEDYDDLLERGKGISGTGSRAGAKKIVRKVFGKGHVLITTYAGLKTYSDLLLNEEWEYAILDEGHKIRNPDAGISVSCKQLKTRHRIILSGTPLQNNLTELWSLFDFVFPGRLGTLPIFQTQFAIPIRIGGYANASNVQVQTAYKCAVALRELISPYLLRRLKVDVAADLPRKTEKVLFCKLTKFQRDEYKNFLKSKQVSDILNGNSNSLFGIDILRKICNHPDLVDRDILMHTKGYNYGKGAYSGKMQVTGDLLQAWKKHGHRTLLFAQTRQMLDILERFVNSFDNDFKYRRMDGNTAIHHRQELVDEFNRDTSIDVFLLTTKVGGLGVNLTGADRVIIFDPDWNPSTDMQARERAWRLGQTKSVGIYRLLTAGTIEEKIYHRQIFKQHLALKVLNDPNQKRFFKMDDMHDLFTLGDSTVIGTETGNMFKGAEKVYENGTSLGAEPGQNSDDPSELRKIAGVAGLEEFSSSKDDNASDKDKSEEMRFMESIFGGSGVLSALEHDTVMNASRSHSVIAEKEATRVAEAAAKALRESIRTTQAAAIGTVTWTGKFGSAGKEEEEEEESPPVVPTAAGLLATLRRRNSPGGSGINSATMSRVGSKNASARSVTARPLPLQQQPKGNGVIGKLREFMKGKGGNATSGEISEFAKGVIQADDKQQMIEFRYMLKEIAVLNKEERVWSLKKDYL